jgi:hypothetical protein
VEKKTSAGGGRGNMYSIVNTVGYSDFKVDNTSGICGLAKDF